MIIRTCAACGSQKTGAAAEMSKQPDAHDQFWDKMHLPTCPWKPLDVYQKMDYFMENGSPVSSVHED